MPAPKFDAENAILPRNAAAATFSAASVAATPRPRPAPRREMERFSTAG